MKGFNNFRGYNEEMKERSRQLRKNMTPQEKHLWYDYLRRYPIKIYRQRSIDWFIADFYCDSARLVIEVDGGQHYTPDGKEYDTDRDAILRKYNLSVLRIKNEDVEKNFSNVCKLIDNQIREEIKKTET